MMTSRRLVEYLAAEPFRPFRVRMTSGEKYEVRHPEMILIGKASTRIFAATGDSEDERWHDLSMLLMESVEPIESQVAR